LIDKPRNPKPPCTVPWNVPKAATEMKMSRYMTVHQVEVGIKFKLAPGHFRHQHRFRACQWRLTNQLGFALELNITNTFTTSMQDADLRIAVTADQMTIEMEAIYG
jgi:hypothetical protein